MSDIGQDAGQQPVDRKELLSQQFEAAEQAPATAVTAPPAQTDASPSASGERPRAPDGKFVPKDAAAAAPRFNALKGTDPITQADALAQPVPVVEPAAWDKAPASWKKEKHALWQAMTPEQREYAWQREEQMRSGVEPLLPKAELADKITKASEPYMNTIRGLGLDLPQAVAGLMKVDHDLRTLPYDQKLNLLVQTARGYGIDLMAQGQAQGAQPMYDQNYSQLQNELVAIKGQFSSFTQQQEAAQQRAALDEIQRFAKTAEHFEDVKSTMAQLLQSNMAEGIPDAYEKAVRLHPEIFDAIQTAKQASSEADKRKAADEAAKRAKAAAVSVRSATPGTAKPTNAQDRRSMLAEQIGGLSERL